MAPERRASVRRRSWWRYRHNRHLVPLLTRAQRWMLRALVAVWAASTTSAAAWWAEPRHWGSAVGMGINSALLAVELVILPSWFYVWLSRMKRPDRRLPVPGLRAAIIVTKAPSEPWAVVRETLEAMLAQDYPHAYDVWLADEAPDERAREWCREHGVRISTRHGITGYHRPSWPRRTRCKEGNLAFFYDVWGYRLYDVVAQLDADHVPAPDYLRCPANIATVAFYHQTMADSRPAFPRIGFPTQVYFGTDPKMYKIAHGEYLARLIPGCELVVFEHSAHMTFVEDTDGYLDAVRRFLDRISGV